MPSEKGQRKGKAKKGKGKTWKPKVQPDPSDPHASGSFNLIDDPQKRCFFHNLGPRDKTKTCNGQNCDFNHERLPDNEFKHWRCPAKSRPTSQAASRNA